MESILVDKGSECFVRRNIVPSSHLFEDLLRIEVITNYDLSNISQ